jgi:DNA invertase Pin-like site-specific DNA recombinase
MRTDLGLEAKMKLGYARVSTASQTPEQQCDLLRKAGCERIFTETASGAKEDRAELARMLDMARAGDVIVVWKLDRLARSIRHLIQIADMLKARGIQLQSLSDDINTTTASGELLFHMLGALAQFERSLIRERVNAGLQRAWSEGKRSGRKRADHPDKIGGLAKAQALIRSGVKPAEAARVAGVARSTVYKYMGDGKTDGAINGQEKRTDLRGSDRVSANGRQ